MDRSDYRAKAIEYLALAKAEQDPLMAAQLKNVRTPIFASSTESKTRDLL
jgi:hypothetical protein